jgi:hypothetical protein
MQFRRREFVRGTLLFASFAYAKSIFGVKTLFKDKAFSKFELFSQLTLNLTGLSELSAQHTLRLLHAQERIYSQQVIDTLLKNYLEHIHIKKQSFEVFFKDPRWHGICQSLLRHSYGIADASLSWSEDDRIAMNLESVLWKSLRTPPAGVPAGFSSWSEAV